MMKDQSKHYFRVILILIIFGAGFILGTSRGSERGKLEHVVCIWLKDAGNAAVRQNLMLAAQQLKKIPEVEAIRCGTPLAGTRPMADSSYDVALIVTFKNEKAMEAYLAHPLHQNAVKEILMPIMQKMVIYDFIDGE